MKLFISYSRDDKAFVYDLAEKLRDEGQHDVWIDRRLVGADLWWDTILEAIEKCECFVSVMSPKFVASIYCGGELDYALALKKPILPLMLKSCDMPPSLKAVQYTDINGLSIMECLLRAEKALSRVEIRLLKGEYPALTEQPHRPPVPEPQANPEHLYEVFSAAEEAAANSNPGLAEKLFSQVIQADPQGLGVAAAERLTQIKIERDRAVAYTQIVKLAENPSTVKGARAAWKVYMQKFGLDHDPNGYALKLSDNPALAVRGEDSPYNAGVFTRSDLEGTVIDNAVRGKLKEMLPDFELMESLKKPGHLSETLSPGTARLDSKGIPQVWVPLGCFMMGREPTEDIDFTDEQPQHEVCITKGFWLDQFPVTNDAFQKFIDDGGYQKRQYWSGAGWRWRTIREIDAPEAYEGFIDSRQPRVGVTWFEAEAYSKWRGGRLPTEAEWEYAAGGPESLEYPWGNDYDESKLNTEKDVDYTSPVEKYEGGKSWVGAYDMAGNVWEWVFDWYDEQYYKQEIKDDPKGSPTGTERVIRGGAWDFHRKNARTAYRFKAEPAYTEDNIGFRTVTDS